MAADGGTEMDSLFEGMDFVMPLDDEEPPGANAERNAPSVSSKSGAPLSRSPSLSEPAALSVSGVAISPSPEHALPPDNDPSESQPQGAAAAAAAAMGGPQRDPNEPLDESLFGGLALSSADGEAANQARNAAEEHEIPTSGAAAASAEAETPNQLERSASMDESAGRDKMRDGGRSGGSTESIMAVYDDAPPRPSAVKRPSSGAPPISRTGSPSLPSSVKPSMRRKKRSVKIGYGREEEENEELASRKVGIREAFGAGVLTKDSASNASSGSTPTLGLSRESSQREIHFEASTLGSAHENGGVSSGGISLSKYSTLEVHGIEKVASREISDEVMVPIATDGSGVTSVGAVVGEGVELGSSRDDKMRSAAADDAVVADVPCTDPECGTVIVETEFAVQKEIEGAAGPSEDGVIELDMDYLAERKDGTIEERLKFVQDAVAFKLKALHERMSAISSLRNAAVHKRRQAADEVAAASTKRRQLEAELDAACEREDFETADSLSGRIVEAESVLAEVGEAFTAAEADCDFAASELQEVLDSQVAVEEKGAGLLRLLKLEAEDAAEKVLREAQETESREMKRLTEEEEKTAARQKAMDLQRKEIEDSNSELTNAIQELTVSDTEERTALTEQRSQLASELRDLLALVRTKEAEIAEFDERIAAVDEKVSTVAATFEDRRNGLDSELETLTNSERQLAKDCISILEGRGRVEQILADTQQERLRLENLARFAADAAGAMQNATEIKRAVAVAATQSREKRAELIERERQAHAEANLLRQNAASARLLLQELSSTKEKLGQELAVVKDRIAFVDKRVPELDTEKKLAATARNFKVAGRLAAEAKALTAEKEAAIADVERIARKIADVDRKSEVKLNDLGGLDDGIAAKEREAAMAHCERLRLVAAAARHERDVAIELNDIEEGESLTSEANAADAEAQVLQENYQLEGREYEIRRNLSVSEGTDSMTKEEAVMNCERLRLVASAARGERDAAIERDQYDEAETLHLKAGNADAEADRLQRLYQLEDEQFEGRTTVDGNDQVGAEDQAAAIADGDALHSVADTPEDERGPAINLNPQEGETVTPNGGVADSEDVRQHAGFEDT